MDICRKSDHSDGIASANFHMDKFRTFCLEVLLLA